jgi:hypothetical protein
MAAIDFSAYNFSIKSDKDVNYVFDIIRKKWIVATPEEWVRQHVLHYLVYDNNYPASLIAVERGLVLNGRRKRFDIVVFNPQGKASMVIECKRPDVALGQEVFDQIAQYNAVFGARYLWITNAREHRIVFYHDDFLGYEYLHALPEFRIL